MNQQFKRDGNNIFTSITISFVEAILGCKKEIKALTKSFKLSVPAGTQPDTVMRLKNQGLSIDGKSGDLFVTIKIQIPNDISEKQKELLTKWDA